MIVGGGREGGAFDFGGLGELLGRPYKYIANITNTAPTENVRVIV